MSLFFDEVGGYSVFGGPGFAAPDAFVRDGARVHFLSLGRHCLRALYASLKPRRVFLPKYTCHSVKQTMIELGAEVVYYNLRDGLIPDMGNHDTQDMLVINNYFGLASWLPEWKQALPLRSRAHGVVDNTQALCRTARFGDCWSFLSPRKFLPVTDGGLLCCPDHAELEEGALPRQRDVSWGRMHWLFRAIDDDARSVSYAEYLHYRQQDVQAIAYAGMSRVTRHLLSLCDVDNVIRVRNERFVALHSAIPIHPWFGRLQRDPLSCPIGYPIQVRAAAASQAVLAKHKVYALRYWPELSGHPELGSLERCLLDNMLLLPLDGGYADGQMSVILDQVDEPSA